MVLSSLSYLSLGVVRHTCSMLHGCEIKSGQRPGNEALSTLAALRIGSFPASHTPRFQYGWGLVWEARMEFKYSDIWSTHTFSFQCCLVVTIMDSSSSPHRTVRGDHSLYIHPSSILSQERSPQWYVNKRLCVEHTKMSNASASSFSASMWKCGVWEEGNVGGRCVWGERFGVKGGMKEKGHEEGCVGGEGRSMNVCWMTWVMIGLPDRHTGTYSSFCSLFLVAELQGGIQWGDSDLQAVHERHHCG